MTKEQQKQTRQQAAQAVRDFGGEMCAPLVVFQFVEIGARVAENLTAEDIAEEVKKQEEEEKEAEARGMICLTSAEWVRWLLESVAKFAKLSAPVRSYLIRKYYL